MDFPSALKECLAGKIIFNTGWNGQNQYVFMLPGYLAGVPANSTLSKAARIPEGETVIIPPYLMLKNAQGQYVNWIPSTGDIFSKKWEVRNV